MAIVDAVNLGCGCQKQQNIPLEYEIPKKEDIKIIIKECKRFNSCSLKNKIIFEFTKVLNQLECGIQPDIELLLEEISLVSINDGL